MNQDSPKVIDRSEDDLFASVPIGFQANAMVTGDVGWACFELFESLGIESIIGVTGFDSADHFKKWFESVISIELNDWEPVEVTLYECWMPCHHDQFPESHYFTLGATEANRYEGQFCYIVWRNFSDPDAIRRTRRNVFALRHVAFPLKSERGLEFFHTARGRSYSARYNVFVSRSHEKSTA